MSLINDALKRTRDAMSASRAPDVESYRITSQPAVKSKQPRTVIWIAAIVGVVVIAVACFVAYRFLTASPVASPVADVKPEAPPAPTPAVAREEAPASTPTQPVAGAKTASDSTNQNQVVALAGGRAKDNDTDTTSAVAPDPDADPDPPTPKPVVVVEPPKLTLEGITEDEFTRDALINGVNLKIGDEFMGATVTAIDNRVVRLKFDGKEIVLRMP